MSRYSPGRPGFRMTNSGHRQNSLAREGGKQPQAPQRTLVCIVFRSQQPSGLSGLTLVFPTRRPMSWARASAESLSSRPRDSMPRTDWVAPHRRQNAIAALTASTCEPSVGFSRSRSSAKLASGHFFAMRFFLFSAILAWSFGSGQSLCVCPCFEQLSQTKGPRDLGAGCVVEAPAFNVFICWN